MSQTQKAQSVAIWERGQADGLGPLNSNGNA